jgi:hypothetical protein
MLRSNVKFLRTFTLKNTGKIHVLIRGIRLPEGRENIYMRLESWVEQPFELAPGESAEVCLSLVIDFIQLSPSTNLIIETGIRSFLVPINVKLPVEVILKAREYLAFPTESVAHLANKYSLFFTLASGLSAIMFVAYALYFASR